MPYIKSDIRELFDKDLENIGDDLDEEGELNYCITYLCLKYLKRAGKSYSAFNSIVGVLECAKLEMYRRSVAPYEDIKIKDNGDVVVS